MAALRGGELGDFAVLLIRKIMTIGIFLLLFNTDFWVDPIWNSFAEMGSVVNSGMNVTPDNIIVHAINMVSVILDNLSLSMKSVVFILVGIIALIALALIAIDLLMVFVKFYLMHICVFFALALGGLEHYKSIGLNPILAFIKIGIELFFIKGLAALLLNLIQGIVDEVHQQSDKIEFALSVLVSCLIFVIIVKLVPPVIEAIFQGTIGQNEIATQGFKAVAAAAIGGSAALALKTVKGTAKSSSGAAKAIRAAHELKKEGGGGMMSNITKSTMASMGDKLAQGTLGEAAANRMRLVASELAEAKLSNISGDISADKNSNEGVKSSTYQSGVPNMSTNTDNSSNPSNKAPESINKADNQHNNQTSTSQNSTNPQKPSPQPKNAPIDNASSTKHSTADTKEKGKK